MSARNSEPCFALPALSRSRRRQTAAQRRPWGPASAKLKGKSPNGAKTGEAKVSEGLALFLTLRGHWRSSALTSLIYSAAEAPH